MRGLSIKGRLLIVFALIAFTQVIVAVIALRGVGLSSDDLAQVYQERLVPVSQLARINDLMHVSIEQLTIAVIARPSPSNVQKYIDRVESNLAEIDGLIEDYAKHVASDEDRRFLAEWTTHRDMLIGKGIKPAIAALKAQQ
jgi:methyl-accepting chemotaxis protein